MTAEFLCPYCKTSISALELEKAGPATCPHCRGDISGSDFSDDKTARSAGGSRLIRHQVPETPLPVVLEATQYLDEIEAHIEKTIGRAPIVQHEIVSTGIHIDLHIVAPTNLPPSPEHPFGTYHYTVVTSGVSSRPMKVPAGYPEPPLLELMIALPAGWPGLLPDGNVNPKLLSDENNWWPFRWLKALARFPVQFDTFLGDLHTVPNGQNSAPFATNTRLGCMMVMPPALAPNSRYLQINDRVAIQFLALVPLYSEEMAYKLQVGGEELRKLALRRGVNELVQPGRASMAPGAAPQKPEPKSRLFRWPKFH